MRFPLVLLMSLACKGGDDSGEPAEALDLTERLGPDRSRAGEVVSEAALFGGVSADAQVGDYKIYNDRAQFIIQGTRDGHYYVRYGGSLIDADMVRAEGESGRDIIDDMSVMVGLGRLMEPDSIEVIEDGRGGSAAVIRVTGHAAPMELLTGAMENPDMVPFRDVLFTTDYILEPASPLLRLETRLDWMDEATTVQPGDLLVASMDVAVPYHPGGGLDTSIGSTGDWLGMIGMQNEVALALLTDVEPWPASVVGDLLTEIGPILAGLEASALLEDGGSLSYSRYVGVAPDFATLTDAWYAIRGVETDSLSGTVSDGSEPVAGARVHIMDAEGAVITMAHTDAQGSWSASVPAGTEAQIQATGRGQAQHADLAKGAGWVGPYNAASIRAVSERSLEDGAAAPAFAEGYGVTDVVAAGEDLQLLAPGIISIDIADGRPAVVRVEFASGDPVSRNAVTMPGRPSGSMARAYLADGAIEIPVEPGDYEVIVHRGATWEAWSFGVSLVSGQRSELSPILEEVITPEGVLRMDPHSHAAPSGDGQIGMAHRLLVHAANGMQVHFGTDHDHVADYRPLLEPLGLSPFMASILSDEVSPYLRGHHNIYPLEALPDEPNHGAPAWQAQIWTTEELHQQLRDRLNGGILQVNHGVGSSGMFTAAGIDDQGGVVAVPDHWSPNFDAMEVLNDGQWEEFTAVYFDLLSRGLEPTPVGVSDAHGYQAGEDLSYVFVGHSDPSSLTSEELIAAFLDRAVVASTGPYIEAMNDYQWAPGTTVEGAATIDVTVFAPSWMQVDQLDLLENGEVIETVEVAEEDAQAVERLSASFELSPDADAHYVFMARGSEGMSPVYPGRTAWAMTAAIRVDLDGDGWDPPLPALTTE